MGERIAGKQEGPISLFKGHYASRIVTNGDLFDIDIYIYIYMNNYMKNQI